MLLHIVLLAATRSGDLGPTLPPGLNAAFTSTVLDVESKLSASDFAGASQSAALLPTNTITVRWDESKIPADKRALFAAQRDRAISEWEKAAGAKITVSADHASLSFDFLPVLKPSSTSGLPAGTQYKWPSETSPGMRCTIGLQRGNPSVNVGATDIHNAVSQAIGMYFGVAPSPTPGTLFGTTELSFTETFLISDTDTALAKEALSISDLLRTYAKEQKVVTPARPAQKLDAQSLEIGHFMQGDPANFGLKIANNGNAPLALRFMPDCGCVITDRTATIAPGSAYTMSGSYDTTLHYGDIRHVLTVVSNDPSSPITQIPVHVVIQPKYQLLVPDDEGVELSDLGADVTAYLIMQPNSKTKIQSASVGGNVSGTATFEPWSGMLADPELGEQAKPRVGYKIVAHVSGKTQQVGRIPLTIAVSTDDPKFRTLVTSFTVQRGIAASPNEVYMGEVGSAVRNYSLFITGPKAKVHVKKATCDWPHMAVQVFTESEGTAYRIQLTYDGKAPQGDVKAVLTVNTDNPSQPVIKVPITGRVA